MSAKNTLYDHLRLSRNCSLEEIKRSYKKLALLYHPDKNPRGEEIFKTIVRAYKVLSDPGEREAYDKKHFRSSPPPLQKTADTVVEIEVTLEELYCGAVKTVKVQRSRLCRICSGAQAFIRCGLCDQRRVICERIPVKVKIERGMRCPSKITLPGKGGQKLGCSPGDLVVNLSEKKHPTFKRVKDNLLIHINISITDALCGFTKTIRTLDGRILMINEYSGKVTKHGTLRCVMDEGMPFYINPSLKGKLIVKFKVEFPDELDSSTIQQLERALPPRSPVNIPAAPEIVSMCQIRPDSKYCKLFDDPEN